MVIGKVTCLTPLSMLTCKNRASDSKCYQTLDTNSDKTLWLAQLRFCYRVLCYLREGRVVIISARECNSDKRVG